MRRKKIKEELSVQMRRIKIKEELSVLLNITSMIIYAYINFLCNSN